MPREARRIHRELTQDERERLERARAAVAAELPDLVRRDRLRTEAASEQAFSGELRRAVHRSELTIKDIADRCGVPLVVLDEFLTGEGTLGTDVLDRLLEALELTLTHADRTSP
ncbi:MAG: hypothetical protein WD066_00485 [Planctomycetaceae bacterium]